MSRSTATSPTITPQMSVLGRDGRDLNVGYHETPFLLNQAPLAGISSSSSAAAATAASACEESSSKGKWWGTWKFPSSLSTSSKLINGTHADDNNANDANGGRNNYAAHETFLDKNNHNDHNDIDDSASYTSMGGIHDGDEYPPHSATFSSQQPKVYLRSTRTRSNENALFTSVAATAAAADEFEFDQPPAKEEAVRNDCSFFYQDLEERPSGTTATTTSRTTGNLNTFGVSTYNPLVPTPPRHRAAYRARFQQLNEEWRRHSDDIYDDDNELWLHDEEADDEHGVLDSYSTTPLSVVSSNVLHSSLCWAQHDGRILMTLPKDKVRLLMDEDLEPGILSVERADTNNNNRNNNNNNSNHYHDNHPKDEIMYVLTVDENLYRRVIGEISDATSSRFGLHQFCTDEGRVDISVAVMCLLLVMLILFINTIIWPVQ